MTTRFIDEVRLAPVNNGFFPFEFARDIADLLRKQWSGMFFDFLQQRSTNDQLRATTNLLSGISQASDKVEELVRRLYRHIDATGADAAFDAVEKKSSAKTFFGVLLACSPKAKPDQSLSIGEFDTWYDYWAAATNGEIVDGGKRITWRSAGWQWDMYTGDGLRKLFDAMKRTDPGLTIKPFIEERRLKLDDVMDFARSEVPPDSQPPL